MDQRVFFEVYLKENNEMILESLERISFDISMRVIDMRDEIMWKMYNSTDERASHDEYYLEIENISPNLVKEFGKLFFNKGLLPKTMDNYPLSRITSVGSSFVFAVYRVKKSELKDYIPVKRLYEMSEKEQIAFDEKVASKNKKLVTTTWSSSEDEEEKVVKKDTFDYASLYKKKYNEDDW